MFLSFICNYLSDVFFSKVCNWPFGGASVARNLVYLYRDVFGPASQLVLLGYHVPFLLVSFSVSGFCQVMLNSIRLVPVIFTRACLCIFLCTFFRRGLGAEPHFCDLFLANILEGHFSSFSGLR